MKYKGLKLMSQNDMKNVKGGVIPVTGCVAICYTTKTGVGAVNYYYAVSGLENCSTNFPCWPGDQLIDCSCTTVNFPGN